MIHIIKEASINLFIRKYMNLEERQLHDGEYPVRKIIANHLYVNKENDFKDGDQVAFHVNDISQLTREEFGVIIAYDVVEYDSLQFKLINQNKNIK